MTRSFPLRGGVSEASPTSDARTKLEAFFNSLLRAEEDGGNDQDGQCREHGQIDSDTAIAQPGGLPVLGIQRLAEDVEILIVDSQDPFDFDQRLFRHPMPIALLE